MIIRCDSSRPGIRSDAVPADRVLYIGGYGRSGSTVLATILGNHPDVVSPGELAFVFEDLADPDRLCSCGLPFGECRFWKDLHQELLFPQRFTELARREETFGALLRRFAVSGGGAGEDYAEVQRRVFEHVRRVSGKSIVVDSSKSAWLTGARALALEESAEDVLLLHLVRDGQSSLESMVERGDNWALEGHRTERSWRGTRATTGWLAANLSAEAAGRALGDGRYLRMSYESFLADPADSLLRIGSFLGIEMGELVRRVRSDDEFDVGHMVGGNRVRFEGSLRLTRPSKEKRPRALAIHHRTLFSLVAGWLNRRYGYDSGWGTDDG